MAASAATCPKVGGERRACANFMAVDITSLFFEIRAPILNPQAEYLFDTEAVIVPGEGTNFKPKYYKGKFDIHQRAYAIFDFKDIDGKYLYYLMHIIKRDLIRVSVGTTVISLRLPHFQNLKIIFPENPKEQQKIAEILETVDKAIEQTDKIIEKYKHMKQGLMQDLLTLKMAGDICFL